MLFSCNISNERFIIEKTKLSSNGTSTTENKFDYKNYAYGFHYTNNTNVKVQDVTISFSKEQLSDILDKLEYSYNPGELKINPVLNIDYYKENTTKEKAVKEIISRLKKTYNF